MKRFLSLAFLGILPSSAALLITAVYDGPLNGGLPKGIELVATADIADLSQYGVGFANNGGGSDGEEYTFASTSLTAGSFIYIASESIEFTNFMGFAPTYTSGFAAINGDDSIELYHSGAVIDAYGDVNTSGSGTSWDYEDGWAYRNNGSTAGAFDLSEWTVSGANALDTATANATATTPIPIGTYTVPEPNSLALLGLGLLPLTLRRR